MVATLILTEMVHRFRLNAAVCAPSSARNGAQAPGRRRVSRVTLFVQQQLSSGNP